MYMYCVLNKLTNAIFLVIRFRLILQYILLIFKIAFKPIPVNTFYAVTKTFFY